MAKPDKGEKALGKRVSALEREVRSMTKEAPQRPEDQVRQAMPGERPDFLRVSQGNANFEDPVRRDIDRLHGRSTSDLVSDRDRGSASQLGHGTGSRKEKRK